MARARRCSVCGRPAVVEVRYARRYFCAEHFIEYIERKVEKTVKEYRLVREGDHVIAAVSGGKDSATLAGTLSRVLRKLGARLTLLYIDLGIPVYSRESLEASRRLADALDLELVVFPVKEVLGYSVPELALRARRPVCSVCGAVKRYVMNAAAIELGADSVATGHNADDIAAYALKAFLTGSWEELAKQGPKSPPVPGMAAARIKPLYKVYEKESFLYSMLRGLPFYHEECPHARFTTLDFRLKELINKLEDQHPGVKLQLLSGLARGSGRIAVEEWSPVPCRHCGLISQGGECTLCKITRRITGRPGGPVVREWLRRRAEPIRGAGAS